jgi:hypothetical protein
MQKAPLSSRLDMLAIKYNPPSLWSLITGNLGSILTGNQHCVFLKDADGRLAGHQRRRCHKGFAVVPLRSGRLLQLP